MPKSFATAVKRQMAISCPKYTYVSTSGGSGPLITFERPRAASRPHLQEQVVFQKGLHGSPWFRVSLFASFEAHDANGKTIHMVLDGAPVGNDVRYASDAELEAALERTCTAIDDEAQSAFASAQKQYRQHGKLFTDLVGHYSRFLKTDGSKLSADDFVDTLDAAPPTIVAFDAFMRFLEKQKLAPKNHTTALWQFWHHGRPMRASDYRKGDYYTCTICGRFASLRSGKLVKHGSHHAYVCNKH